MDRRIAGAMLLVGALLAVLGVPALAGRYVAGAAFAVPVPGPPRAGDCLVAVSGGPDQSTVTSAAPPLPTGTIGSCHGLLAGEVVSVTAGNLVDPSSSSNSQGSFDLCAANAIRFLGMPATRAVAGVTWTPALATGNQEIGPDLRQRSEGQRWSACVVTGATAQYRGSMRASATGGLVPDPLGLCWPGEVRMDAALVSCSTPHAGQLLATGIADGRTPVLPASLAGSCREYAIAVLGGLDPQVADQLTVRVSAQGIGPQVLLCSVAAAGDRQLHGSVLGIGTRPLPLTG